MKRYSKKIRDSVVKSLEGGNKIMASLKAAGIHFSTYQEWTNPNNPRFDPEFTEAVKKALEQGVTYIEEICADVILKSAVGRKAKVEQDGAIIPGKEGVWQAAAWMLERTLPDKYALNQKIKMDADVKTSVDVSKYTEEEKAFLLKLARKYGAGND